MMAPSAIIEIVKCRISLRQDSSTSLFSDEGPRYDKLMHEIISANVHKTIARMIDRSDSFLSDETNNWSNL